MCHVQTSATPEYTRAHAALSSQGVPYSVTSGKIAALETAVSRISSHVSNNEVSLKHILQGQNFMSQLLMRFMNSDSDQGNSFQEPPLLHSKYGHDTEPSPISLHPAAASPTSLPSDGELCANRGTSSLSRPMHPPLATKLVVVTSPRTEYDNTDQPRARAGDSMAYSPHEHYPPPLVPERIAVDPSPALARGPSPPSWMSGSTILITPSMDLRRPGVLRSRSPTAMSTDISDSIRTPSVMEDPLAPFLNIYRGHDNSWRASRDNQPSQVNQVHLVAAPLNSRPSLKLPASTLVSDPTQAQMN